MTYFSSEAWYWPIVYIGIAGWIATDMWRWFGVIAGNRLKEGSLALLWVRATATSLVAAVIAKLILQPTGALSEFNIYLRIFAVIAGFVAFQMTSKRIVVGCGVALLVLLLGNWALNFQLITRTW